MSAHSDKTLHRKIYNINDTDTFSPYPFFENVIFTDEFMHEFMCIFAHQFVKEFFTNFVQEFKYEIYMNFCSKNWLCYKWPVLYKHWGGVFSTQTLYFVCNFLFLS